MILNTIISFCTLFFLFICLKLIFIKSEYRYINTLFALAILGRSGLNILSISIDEGALSLYNYPLLLKILNPLYYSIPSFIYIYFRGILTGEKDFTKTDIIHFLPFAFGLIDISFYLFDKKLLISEIISIQDLRDNYLYYYISGPLTNYFFHLLRPLLFTIYFILIIKMLYKKKYLKIGWQLKARERWVMFIILLTIVYHFLQIFQWFNLYMGEKTNYFKNNYGIFVLFPVLVLLGVILFILQNPDILYGHLYKIKNWQHKKFEFREMAFQSNHDLLEVNVQNTNANKVLKDIIPNAIAIEYANQLAKTMQDKKLFLKKDLQIVILANETDILVHHCSYAINKIIGKNFRDWTNEYRINYFIKIYQKQKTQKTIDAIAKESGFKNISTFYNAFKKTTGLSPTQYFK